MRDYAIVAAGLIIGLMARWAVVLSLGQPLGWKVVRVDFLVLSFNGLLALMFGEMLALHGVKLAVEAAMLGASSTIVFSNMHGAWLKKNAPGPATVFAGEGETVKLSPHAIDVEVQTVGDKSPQSTAEVGKSVLKVLRGAEGNPFGDLLDKLDGNG